MNFSGKKILVTGGSGFIGKNLIKNLEGLNAEVVNYDTSNGNNILDRKNLEKTVKKKFEIIYHLAGFSGSRESNKDIEKTFQLNTLSTVNLLDLIAKYSPNTKFIFSSSRLEYGKPHYLPVDEEHPTEPISTYGLSKLCSTQTALIHHKIYNLNVTILRTSNVYGPHKDSKFTGYNLINHFIDLATKNRYLTIFGNGTQKRDYLYIDDMVDALLLTLDPKANGQIYNLGHGTGISLKEMAELAIRIIGKGRLRFVAWPKFYKEIETGDYITDISKIKSELGFQPKVDFENGIRKTLGNYK